MVTDDTYGVDAVYRQLVESAQDVTTGLQHMSGQMDIMNHSLHVQSQYLMWSTVSIMLLAALIIFLVGYIITRR